MQFKFYYFLLSEIPPNQIIISKAGDIFFRERKNTVTYCKTVKKKIIMHISYEKLRAKICYEIKNFDKIFFECNTW